MRGPRYSIIPSGAVFDDRLQGRDLQVLAVLGTHTDDGGWAIRSQVKMAAAMRCARSTVQASLTRLVDAGYVEVFGNKRRDGGDSSNWYRVRLDVQPAPEAEAELHIGADDCGASIEGETADTPPADIPAGGADIPAGVPPHGSAGVPAHGSAPLTRVLTRDSTNPPKAPKGAKETRASDDDEEGFGRFFEMWTSADPGLRFDLKGRAFANWKRLTADEREAAAMPATITAVITGQRRAKRTTLMNAATYLRDKAFERVEVTPAASASAELVPLSLFGRAWWCRFYEFAKGGGRSPAAGKAKFMAQQAERGQGVAVPLAEAQALEGASAGFAYVLVASPEFVAWREWFAERGFRLPRPAKVDRIWMPSAIPPEGSAAEAAQ